MPSSDSKHKALTILGELKNAEKGFLDDSPGSREQLLNLTYALTSALELPSEAIQRMGWAEVRSGVAIGLTN